MYRINLDHSMNTTLVILKPRVRKKKDRDDRSGQKPDENSRVENLTELIYLDRATPASLTRPGGGHECSLFSFLE